MSPDEIITNLRPLNINISRRTLLNYEVEKLISEPVRGGNGRGRGRTTEYNENAWKEVYVAYRMLHGMKFSKDIIREARSKLFGSSNGTYCGQWSVTGNTFTILYYALWIAAYVRVPAIGTLDFIYEKWNSGETLKAMQENLKRGLYIDGENPQPGATYVIIPKEVLLVEWEKSMDKVTVIIWDSESKQWKFALRGKNSEKFYLK